MKNDKFPMEPKTEYLTGQDFISMGGSAIAGFNRRVSGESYTEAFQYPHERTDMHLHSGWNLADKLIDDGIIFYVHNFHHLECNGGYAFKYGGTWVCNKCQRDHLNNETWKIRTFKDGNAWCCIGLGFINLQESNNYGFGDTIEQAREEYHKAVLAMEGTKGV